MNNYPIALILHDIRSAHNVGAIFRTADACGVETIYVSGHTPYPAIAGDTRPPHVVVANTKAIAKTALGSENTVAYRRFESLSDVINDLHHNQYKIIALEQSEDSQSVYSYKRFGAIGLMVGNEVDGIDPATLELCDAVLELPMVGSKESLNVAVATGIALYQLRFGS